MAQDLVSKPDASVLYMARRSDLRLTHTPRYPVLSAEGRKLGMGKGVFPSFRNGVARWPQDGEAVIRDGLDGGKATMPAKELHAWLQNHELYGDLQEGFWKVEQPPPPVSQEEQERMMHAALALDVATLSGMAEQERAGWGREAIIVPCEEAVGKIETVKQQERERAEAAAAEAKPKTAAKAKAAS